MSDEDGDKDKEDSYGSHDSGFARMAKELKANKGIETNIRTEMMVIYKMKMWRCRRMRMYSYQRQN
jgi:hypothetical protein